MRTTQAFVALVLLSCVAIYLEHMYGILKVRKDFVNTSDSVVVSLAIPDNSKRNFYFYEKFTAIGLFNNSLKKKNETTTYLFAAFVEPKNTTKLVTMEALWVGYGNRVYHVIDALVTALLTDRVCLVNFHTKGPSQLIDLPAVTDSNLYEPFVVDINYAITQYWQPNKNATRLMKTTIPVSHDIILVSAGPHFFETCSNPRYFQKLLDAGAVRQSTVDRARDIENRTNEEQLDRLFQVGFETAHFVLKQAWPLKRNLSVLVDEYKRQHFDNSFVIGLQLRAEYVNETAGDVEKFVNCALGIESKVRTKKQVKWFVASDWGHIHPKISKLMPNRVVFCTNGSADHDPGVQYSGVAVKAMLDIELLSLCDEMVLTGGSTFGFLSAIKALRLPYYVNGTNWCGERCKRMTGCEKMTLGRTSNMNNQLNASVF
jgi:hypothetical protein